MWGTWEDRLCQTIWASVPQFVHSFSQVLSTKCLSLGRTSFNNKMPRVGYDTQDSCRKKIFFYAIIKLPSSPTSAVEIVRLKTEGR